MEPILSTCTNCNGEGLISTGSNKLDLKRGNTITCPVCAGKGKVDANGAPAPVEESPKAQDPSSNAPGGDGSSDSNSGSKPQGPQIGDRCLTADDQPGTLGKNEAGDWVCNPDSQ